MSLEDLSVPGERWAGEGRGRGRPTSPSALSAAVSLLSLFIGTAWTCAEEEDIRFLFDGFPSEIRGPAGAIREVQGFGAILPAIEADSNWVLSMTADGAEIIDVSLDDIAIGTKPISQNHFEAHAPVRGISDNMVTNSEDPPRLGAIVALSAVGYPRQVVSLAAGVTQRVVFLTVQVILPPAGEDREVVLRFEDGFHFTGSPPTENGMTIRGHWVRPKEMIPTSILLRGTDRPFRRADADADGKVDLTDVVFILEALFLGRTGLPCEASADVNDDGQVNIADAVFTLNWLFFGGPQPGHPFSICDFQPWREEPHCSSFPPCQ